MRFQSRRLLRVFVIPRLDVPPSDGGWGRRGPGTLRGSSLFVPSNSRSDRIPTEFDIRLDTGPVKIKSDIRSIPNKNVQIILSNSGKENVVD